MPVSASRAASPLPPGLRPYAFHGVGLSLKGGHGIGDCPFCSGDGKFSVDCETGLWRCFSCGGGQPSGGGNALTFLRLLVAPPTHGSGWPVFYAAVAADRHLLSPATVAAWGLCPALDGAWLVPGYSAEGRLDQLYRRTRIKDKGEWSWRLLPTPGVWPEGKAHALHLAIGDFDAAVPNVVICEGPWDGMALWEVARSLDEGLFLPDTNIIAVPGCNVWRDEWTALCRGKTVMLLYDSDYPREGLGGLITRAGYDGMARVAKRLAGTASSIRYLCWGPDGYDASRGTGWDVRDELTSAPDRQLALGELLLKVVDAPQEWTLGMASSNGQPHRARRPETLPCATWAACEAAWQDALCWRQDMSDALAVLLAVCASTQQAGNQLFLQLVGSAGSAKTTMCDGLLVSRHCHHLEDFNGFHSGFRKADAKNGTCSLLARINGKTLITCEADVLVSSKKFDELMGKARRVFDGKSGHTYNNTDEDELFEGLRTPWIMAGTPAMMDHDQSHLGDRFVRYIIPDPAEDERRAILKKALRSERVALLERSNGTGGSIVDAKTRLAHALTGGYVDWLRANVEDQLPLVDIPESAEDYCIDLAELSADLRARPNEDRRKVETHDSKELPTRLARQNIRLASCLAVVLNKQVVDADVLRIVRKVALDTANGHSLNIVQWLCSSNHGADGAFYQESGGLTAKVLEVWCAMTAERLQKYLLFLRKIDVLEWRQISKTLAAWFLTERVYNLYLRVIGS